MFGQIAVAKATVLSVIGQLAVQKLVLENAVQAPIQAMVNLVAGSEEIWFGPAADEFVEKCTSMAIPMTASISGAVGDMGSGVQRALEIMEDADAQSRRISEETIDIFNNIYR